MVASPLIEKIPLAALIGVMFIFVIGTFKQSSFRIAGNLVEVNVIEDPKYFVAEDSLA